MDSQTSKARPEPPADGWAQGVHRAGLRQGCLAGRPVIVFRRDVIGLQASAPAHPELWGLSGFQEARVRHPPLRGSQVPKCEAPGAPAFGGNDFSLPASGPPAGSRKPAKAIRAGDEERCQSHKDTQDSDGIDPIDLMLVDQSLPGPDAVALHDLQG